MTLVFLKTFFYYKCAQARINTGFHRFTEIGQIFHNRYIDEKTFQVARLHPRRRNWSISCVNNSETQERGLWEVKIEKFHIGACPWTPQKHAPLVLFQEIGQYLSQIRHTDLSFNFRPKTVAKLKLVCKERTYLLRFIAVWFNYQDNDHVDVGGAKHFGLDKNLSATVQCSVEKLRSTVLKRPQRG